MSSSASSLKASHNDGTRIAVGSMPAGKDSGASSDADAGADGSGKKVGMPVH